MCVVQVERSGAPCRVSDGRCAVFEGEGAQEGDEIGQPPPLHPEDTLEGMAPCSSHHMPSTSKGHF